VSADVQHREAAATTPCGVPDCTTPVTLGLTGVVYHVYEFHPNLKPLMSEMLAAAAADPKQFHKDMDSGKWGTGILSLARERGLL
jgi:hypothetical protein